MTSKYVVEALPYDYDALEPYIDEQTMRLHHTKHHQAYVDKLNAAIEKHPDLFKEPVSNLLRDLNSIPEDVRAAVRNHGGGHANHTFFWSIMAPKAGGEPRGILAEAINKTYGSFKQFKEAFTSSALSLFGSGWTWLVMNGNELEIVNTPNQDSPVSMNKPILLGIDLWEHSWYLLRKNEKNKYVEAWWNVVNWPRVERNFKQAMGL